MDNNNQFKHRYLKYVCYSNLSASITSYITSLASLDVQQKQTLNIQVTQHVVDTTQRGRNLERPQTHQKQMDVSLKLSPPSPNVNTLIEERHKGHFPIQEERMSKDHILQHRTAWDQEGYDLVDQKIETLRSTSC
ncbi:MAG: hypothetical protein EZS28_015704 [Streblomastix strix]|uniref:Uncharacterized protein n=1 Tax=Streblomastix strix TaxID=222440 RepID=A0A5J4W2S5_9EUKA|nr:MAG: hypothetical protein EZS28_015704 [Streblomastix strix]